MLNHHDSQPSLADHGTPVQDYVGPQAEGNLPPWQSAPIVSRKADENFSDEEMAAMRAAAEQEVDAKRAARIHAMFSLIATLVIGVIWLIKGQLITTFFFGWTCWYLLQSWSVNLVKSPPGELAYRNARTRSAILGLASEDDTATNKGNPYIRRFQRQAFVVIVLIALILAILLAFNMQPNVTISGIGDVLGFGLGCVGGILIEYLTLCRGVGRLNEVERQRQVDELLNRWLNIA